MAFFFSYATVILIVAAFLASLSVEVFLDVLAWRFVTANLLAPFGDECIEENLLKLSTKHEANDVPVFAVSFTGELIERILRRQALINETLRPIYEIRSAQRGQL